MRFLYDNEVEAWASDRGLRSARGRALRDSLYYEVPEYRERTDLDARRPDLALDLATSLVAALGQWDEAVLWITRWGVWTSSEDWPRFYTVRGAQGERRSIDDTPGHHFSSGERDLLTEFTALALQNGWDAFLVSSTGGKVNPVRARLSHDEWVEVQGTVPVSPIPSAVQPR